MQPNENFLEFHFLIVVFGFHNIDFANTEVGGALILQ